MNKKDKETKVYEYKNDDLIVYWTPKLCTHSTICFTMLPEVFCPTERPWVKIECSSSEEIIKTVDKCPSGALKYRVKENSKVDAKLAKEKVQWIIINSINKYNTKIKTTIFNKLSIVVF